MGNISEKALAVLSKLFDQAPTCCKWEECCVVPCKYQLTLNELHSVFQNIPKRTVLSYGQPDMCALLSSLLFDTNFKEINMCLINITEEIIGIQFSFNEIDEIEAEHVDIILKAYEAATMIDHENINNMIQNGQYGVIKVINNDYVIKYTFDPIDFSIKSVKRDSLVANTNQKRGTLSFLMQSRILTDGFYDFALKMLISMTFVPIEKSIHITMGNDALLLNFPTSENRVKDLINLIYPNSVIRTKTKILKNASTNAVVTATVSFVLTKEEPLLMFFSFINNFPQDILDDEICPLSLSMLRSIDWSSLNISLVPNPVDDLPNSIQKMPFCIYSRYIGQPGIVIVIFLNASKNDEKKLAKDAVMSAFTEMNNDFAFTLKNRKVYKRLDSIWNDIDVISSNLSQILSYDSEKNENFINYKKIIWNRCCEITKNNNSMEKKKKYIVEEANNN